MRWGPVDDDLTPEEKIPMLAVRRTGKAAFYAALHEPFKEQPVIRGFRYLNRPDKAAPVSAVGVEIIGTDYTDRVYQTLGLPGHSSAPGATNAVPDDPLTTLSDQDDPSQGIAYRGQAYWRIKGDTLTARGQIEALSVRAPRLKKLVLNGQPVKARREAGHLLFGTGPWKPDRAPAQPPASPAAWTPPLRASLPQRFVNIDATTGGVLRVRVEHLAAPGLLTNAVAGRLEVGTGPGLAVTPATVAVLALASAERREFSFTLKSPKAGDQQPLTVKLFVTTAGRERLAHTITTTVAVGVTVEEVRQTYDHPMYKDLWEPLQKDRSDTFDRFRVRAPGYTIEIDKFSGTSRSMIDPEGHERIAAAGYPLQFTRGHAMFMRDMRNSEGRYPYEVPCVPAAPDKPKTLGWWSEAKFLGQGTDPASGAPTLRFQTADGLYELHYVFQPERVRASFVPRQKETPGKGLLFDGLCVEQPSYAYRLHVQDGQTFGFRVGPYTVPTVGQCRLEGPYATFRTYPKPPAAGSVRPGNLLGVGDFEDATIKEGVLAGWTADEAARQSCALDTGVKRSVAHSLRYDVTKAVNPRLQAAFAAQAGRAYRVAFWMRTENIRATLNEDGRVPQTGWAASCVRIGLDQPAGWHTWNQFHPAYWPGGTLGDWQRVVLNLPRALANGPVQLSLLLHFGVCQGGAVWIDDVEVQEVE